MIKCPSCGHQEYYGALFCSECGSQLGLTSNTSPETKVRSGKSVNITHQSTATAPAAEGFGDHQGSKSSISLLILGTGQIIALDEAKELTIGRISGEQPILPNVDLTPYQAYEEGVSRLHATIKITHDQVFITDLGSANGTRINGHSITAHDPHSLKNGDMISFGNLKAQIIVR